jgi:hypothetical protein
MGRRVEVTERRRKQEEFAEQARRIAEEDYPEAERIRLVLDNLSAHTAAAFYEAFSPPSGLVGRRGGRSSCTRRRCTARGRRWPR